MSNVFYTSDLHLNHAFVAGTRGFDTAEEHDEAIIEGFNREITKRDHLWILGDVFMGSITDGLEKVKRLNGTKHLVMGNHDACHPLNRNGHSKQRRYLEVFETVSLHAEHRIGKEKVLLSHLPYRWGGDHKPQERHTQWRLRNEGQWLLHGHVHDAFLIRDKQINVGVDFGFQPWSQETIKQAMKEISGV